MRVPRFLIAPALMVAFVALGGAAPVNWARTVTLANGTNGFKGAPVIGNPRARVRVVEYTSYTCPHCAAFVREGQPRLMNYVAQGTVAFEIRNAVRDKLDFASAIAARCGGTGRFVGNHDAVFAAQDQLTERAVAWEAGPGKTAPAEANAALKAFARGSGLSALMAARGIAPPALDACLTSKAMQAPVLAMTNDAWSVRKISGTPTFLVDGQPVQASSFETLDPFIRAGLGGGASGAR